MTTTTQEYHPGAAQVLGKAGSSSGYVIRDFLHRSDIPYEWVEFHDDEEAHTCHDGLQKKRTVPARWWNESVPS